MTTAIAQSHPNIAFIKYWGNRDQKLRLPVSGSISMSLEGLFTRTTVSFSTSWKPTICASAAGWCAAPGWMI